MSVLGIDIGGTNLRVGLIENNCLNKVESIKIKKNGSEDEIANDLISLIAKVKNDQTIGAGIGVPGIVDAETGIAYDLVNIPSWKKINLKKIIESKFNFSVYVNNDANCFVVGEKYFGKVKDYKDIVGLITGTGMGAGLILNNRLYNGKNTGAGEFGMIPYKDKNYEYYCCGQYFTNEHGLTGEEIFHMAESGDEKALEIFYDYGANLGNAIKMILYTIDPEVIILGGSVSEAFKYYEKAMWNSVNQFAYSNSLKTLKILVSELNHSAILGAAALHYDAMNDRQPLPLS